MDIKAGICIDSVFYDVLENSGEISVSGSSVRVSAMCGGVRVVWTAELFGSAARIRLEADCGGDEEIYWMLPFSASADAEQARIIKVPFDNDDWVRFTTAAFKEGGRSYGVGAIYDDGRALAVGVVDHSTWKTAVDMYGRIEVRAGIADRLTRDSCPHGTMTGTVKAPETWLFEDITWQDAMERFAKKYGERNYRLAWNGKSPRGWNSWYAYGKDIDAKKYDKAAEFTASLGNMEGAYVNFDSFWTNLSGSELRSCAEKTAAKGMIPGIYLAPFAIWTEDERLDEPVTDDMGRVIDKAVSWRDIVLKDRAGKILPRLDGGLSLDMTHPIAMLRAERSLTYLKRLGYKYIKLDFLGHGAREGAFYDRSVRTGLRCYNAAMRRILSVWSGDDMFVSLSIAPVFPGGLGHARRVCCDVFGELKDTRYLLNSLTYGWWLNKNIYEFNDPDHICFDKGDAEAKFRFISGLIGGTVFLISSKTEDEEVCGRIRSMTGNRKLMELIDKHITFRPIDRYIKDDTALAFVGYSGAVYAALFNFGSEPMEFDLTPELAGAGKYAEELFSGKRMRIRENMRFVLDGTDCAIVKI